MKLKNKVESVLVLIVVFVILSGCSSTPSVADAEKEIELQIQQSPEFFNLEKVEKINAQESNLMGVKAYILEYQAEVEFPTVCCYFISDKWKFYCKEPNYEFDLSGCLAGQKVQKGQHLIIKGTINFEKTEKGWREDSGQVY